MSEIKFLKIDSFKESDTNDMFEAICKKACDINPKEAKLLINNNLTEDSVIGYKASLSDLIALIGMYDVEFEFKVSFLSREAVKRYPSDEKKKIKLDNGLNVCESYKKMSLQEKEITNPDLIDIVAPVFTPVEVKETPIDASKIPSFGI